MTHVDFNMDTCTQEQLTCSKPWQLLLTATDNSAAADWGDFLSMLHKNVAYKIIDFHFNL